MLSPNQVETITPTLKTIQLICFALIVGVLLAAAIFCAITDWQNINTDFGILPLIGAVIGMALLVKAFVLPGFIGNAAATEARNSSAKSSDERLFKLANAFQTKTIVQYALLESAAFLNLIIFFVTKSIIPLSFVAVLVVAMLMAFPRSPSMEDWVSERME